MNLRLALVTAAFSALCAPASAQSLIEQPSATDVALAYPEAALTAGLNGAVLVACTIGQTGFLEDCHVAREEPADYGFGDAALTLMRHFRYSERTTNGGRSAGLQKRLTVRFTMPEAESSSSAPASRAPAP